MKKILILVLMLIPSILLARGEPYDELGIHKGHIKSMWSVTVNSTTPTIIISTTSKYGTDTDWLIKNHKSNSYIVHMSTDSNMTIDIDTYALDIGEALSPQGNLSDTPVYALVEKGGSSCKLYIIEFNHRN